MAKDDRSKQRKWPLTNQPWELKVVVWEKTAIGDRVATIEKWLQLNSIQLDTGEEETFPLDRGTIRTIREELAYVPEYLLVKLPDTVAGYRTEKLGIPDHQVTKDPTHTSVDKGELSVSDESKQDSSHSTADQAYEDMFGESPKVAPDNMTAQDEFAIRQHDVEIFDKSDAIMDERSLMALLLALEVGRLYSFITHGRALMGLVIFMEYESNKYLSSGLYGRAESLRQSLFDLDNFLNWPGHFYGTGPLSEEYPSIHSIFSLYPRDAVEKDPRTDLDHEYDQQYEAYTDELDKLIDATRFAYREYRALVRETLYV